MSFAASLKKIFTPSELVFYEQYEQLRMDDDRVYLTNLIEAISSDSLLHRGIYGSPIQQNIPL